MKRLSRLAALLLTLAMLLSLVSIAHAEEKQSATAWLLYFASNHETDSSKFPWWPQHKSADQPSSETGVEATNAEVTGPGMYTVGLKFNWQKAEGAIQFNLVLDNAESLFPGYYVKITDIRVNGKSIDHKPNLYGTFHDDPNAGFAPIYNNSGTRISPRIPPVRTVCAPLTVRTKRPTKSSTPTTSLRATRLRWTSSLRRTQAKCRKTSAKSPVS